MDLKHYSEKLIACVILPTYNEAENVMHIIAEIFRQVEKIESHALYVLVVDDDSPDGTYNIVRQLKKEYDKLFIVKGLKKGLGDAYKRGIKYALENFSPNLIIQMDADGQHDPRQIPLFITLSTFGFDVVIGSRFAQGGDTPDFSLWRRFISLFGNWLIRFLGGVPRIHDCTSGYRCLKADILKLCDFRFLSTRGYSFQSSLLFELLRNNAKCIEVPIVFRPRLYGKSKLALRDQLEFIAKIAKIRFRKSEEFIKFITVGLSGTILNLGVYVIFTRLMEIKNFIASPMAIEIAILSNFSLNEIWTFYKRNTTSGPSSILARAI